MENTVLVGIVTKDQGVEKSKDYLDEFDLSEIEYQDGNKKVKVAKNVVASPTVTVNKPSVSKGKDESGTKINSPIIGTAY